MSRKKTSSILIADDDVVLRDLLAYQCESNGIYASLFDDGVDLLKAVNEETLVCVVDLVMPEVDGMQCLRKIKKQFPQTEVIILTNVNQAKEAIAALREGAFDYITKPFDPDEVILAVRKAMQLSKASRDAQEIKESVGYAPYASGLLGESRALTRIKQLIERIAPSHNAVLLTGESGTGKGVVAREIHAASTRSSGPFLTVSCPSLPKDLLESEMFGHEKGAFSGAVSKRLGRAELAEKGTLFLDEIGELPLELQPKLLNFLQDRAFYRVGGEKQIESDVRLIAATNVDLQKKVKEGSFREDLYFRLNVLPIELPPLRERDMDILLLAQFFLDKATEREKVEPHRISKVASDQLMKYSWPGNVRELENAIERAFVLRAEENVIALDDFPPDIQQESLPMNSSGIDSIAGKSLESLEKLAIQETLLKCNGNKAETARVLGITEKSIYNKMKRHGMM